MTLNEKQRGLFKAHALKLLAEHNAGRRLAPDALKWARLWADKGGV